LNDPVRKPGDTKEFWIRERCYIREIVNTPRVREFSLAETRVEPGVTTELHKLGVKEWYVILHGTGIVEVDRQPGHEVVPGDIVEIPAGAAQRISNTGDADLVFQCICVPRFTPDCYESLENGEGGPPPAMPTTT
jgi:mannose-6-phosphate isomerase-like protein (cupin superfamily)